MKILVTVVYSVGFFGAAGPWDISTTRSAPIHAPACEKFAEEINALYRFKYAYCIDAEEPAP